MPVRPERVNNTSSIMSPDVYSNDDNEPPFDYDEAYFSPSIESVAPIKVAAPVESAVSAPKKVISPLEAKVTPIAASEPIMLSEDLPDWTTLVQKLDVKGLVKQLAQQSELLVFEDKRIELRCENRALASNAMAVSGMEKALAAYFKDAPKTLKMHIGTVQATPAKVQAQIKEVELAGAQAIIAQDPTIQALVREFEGMILPNSVRATE